MKWGYFTKGGDVVYLEITGKVDFFVPAKPLPTLILFKNPTMNDWVVAEYLTGLKVGSYKTRKAAKEGAFTEDVCRSVARVLELNAKNWNKVYPEVNAKENQDET